jgi:hypothetical protein
MFLMKDQNHYERLLDFKVSPMVNECSNVTVKVVVKLTVGNVFKRKSYVTHTAIIQERVMINTQ